MRRQHVDVRVYAPADPAAVYALVRDGPAGPPGPPSSRSSWSGPATTESRRVSARSGSSGRVGTSAGNASSNSSRDRRLGYVLVSGLAIRDYRADIDLEPAEGGAAIHWHSSFLPKVPGTGWLYRRTLQRYIGAYAHGLAAYVARPVARG